MVLALHDGIQRVLVRQGQEEGDMEDFGGETEPITATLRGGICYILYTNELFENKKKKNQLLRQEQTASVLRNSVCEDYFCLEVEASRKRAGTLVFFLSEE